MQAHDDRGGAFVLRIGLARDGPGRNFSGIETKFQNMSAPALTTSETAGLIAGLNRMDRNLWWTWNQGAQDLFNELSPRCWQNLYHNAVAVLREVSEYELRMRLQDPEFARRAQAPAVPVVLDDPAGPFTHR